MAGVYGAAITAGPPRVPVQQAVAPDDPPPDTAGRRAFARLVAEAAARNPSWSPQQIHDAVLATPGGRAAQDKHRQEVLFGRR